MERLKKDMPSMAAAGIAASKGCNSSSSSVASDKSPASSVNRIVQENSRCSSSSRPQSKFSNNSRRNNNFTANSSSSSTPHNSLKPEASGRNRRFNKTKNGQAANFYEKKQKGKHGVASGAYVGSNIEIWDGDLIGADDGSGASGSRFKGTKKHNLNHLLNFSFTQRNDQNYHNYDHGLYLYHDDEWSYGHSPRSTQGRSYGVSRARRAEPPRQLSKEQFLQANCQFVVSTVGSYEKQEADPDAPVPWEDIEEIRCFTTTNDGEQTCPICLHAPIAAKITRCGHVFCWSCVLHYLALSDNECRKCPICFYPIYKADLKSVSFLVRLSVKVGDVISLRLMVRKKNSVVAIPADEFKKRKQRKAIHFGRMSPNSDEDCFKKIVIASQEQIMGSVIERERQELKSLWEEEKDSPEVCFIDVAREELEKREATAKFIGSTGDSKSSNNRSLVPRQPSIPSSVKEVANEEASNGPCQSEDKGQQALEETPLPQENKDGDGDDTKADDTCIEETQVEKSSSEEAAARPRKKSSIKSQSSDAAIPGDYVYFYQSSDGQHIYLHDLNIKMLNRQYGGLEFSPTEISAKIISIRGGSVTEKLRRRYPHLQHLPLSCQFRIAELAFEEPLISQETLNEFREKLNKREQRRKEREEEEKRREKLLSEEEKRFYRSMGVRPHRPTRSRKDTDRGADLDESDEEDDDHRSTSGSSSASYDMHIEDFPLPSSSPPGASNEVEENDNGSAHGSPPGSDPEANRTSFATMLREGPSGSGRSKSFGPLAALNASTSADADTEEQSSPPQFTYSLSDAFAAALHVQKGKRGRRKKK